MKPLPLVSVKVSGRTVVGVRLAPDDVIPVAYLLRNMESDEPQEDGDTCRAVTELYRIADQPISSWIDLHQALIPHVARSIHGLTSVKNVWDGLRRTQIIQVGGDSFFFFPFFLWGKFIIYIIIL